MTVNQRWLPRPALSLFIWALWLMLVNDISGGHIVLGAFFAWGIPMLTRNFWPEEMTIKHPWKAMRFIGVVLADIAVANWVVARMILTPSSKLQPAFMVLHLDIQKDFTITLLANTISMTPGTVSVDLAIDRKTLLIHSLHVLDIDAALEEIKRRYEAPLKEMFE